MLAINKRKNKKEDQIIEQFYFEKSHIQGGYRDIIQIWKDPFSNWPLYI